MTARSLFAVLAAALGFFATAAARADANEEFDKANAEFAAGRFKEAIDGYESIVHSGNFSASLFYDLGNAWFRNGDSGRAILNYERALALDAHHPEAAANLRLVRDRARALELVRPAPERYLAYLPANYYYWIAAAAFWLLVFALISGRYSRRRSPARALLLTLAIAALLISDFAIYILATGVRGPRLAIITRPKIEARLATADNANSVLALPPGTEVKILSTRGDWVYAALPNQLRGWVPATSVERVWL
jgi:tetratricopeptide (TPR) repeat protein